MNETEYGAMELIACAHQSAAEKRDLYLKLLIEFHAKADALMAWDNNIIDVSSACDSYKKCVSDMLEITARVGIALSLPPNPERSGPPTGGSADANLLGGTEEK